MSRAQFFPFFILLISVSASMSAQDRDFGFALVKDSYDVEEFAWGKEAAYSDFAVDKLAEYPDDDAILMKKYRFITTQKVGKKLRYWNINRRVVYLQDEGAIEEYSSLSFSDLGLKDRFNDYAVRIFKKNGEVVHLRRDAFTEDGDEIKIVLPGIEVGDIIDYYSFLRIEVYVSNFKVFESDEFYFADAYPVLDQYVEILLKKGMYFKFVSLNDAPEVKIQDTDLLYGFKAKVVIEKQDMAAADVDDNWIYPFREFPVVRFSMAVSQLNDPAISRNLFDKSGKAATSHDNELIHDLLGGQVYFDSQAIGIKAKRIKKIKQAIDALGLESDREKVEEFYKRLLYMMKVDPDTYSPYFSESKILSYLGKYCRELDVDSKWLYVIPRFYGTREDLLVPEELYRVFRMDFDSDTVYVQNMDLYYPFGFLPSYLEGSEAFEFSNYERYSASGHSYNSITLPTSLPEDNGISVNLEMQLIGDSLKGNVTIRNKGVESNGSLRKCDSGESCRFLQQFIPKKYYQSIYDDEDEMKMTYEDLTQLSGDKVTLDHEATSDNLNTFSEWMIATVQSELEGRFGEERVSDIDTLHILDTGLESSKKGFAYETVFTIGGLVTDLGGDKLIEVGTLIGSQVEMGQEDRERKSNIYYNGARTYETEIHLAIPEGFKVEGLEALSYAIENETGIFRSTAEIIEGALVINAIKVYKKNYVAKEDWPMVLEFIDAAYDFSKKKVLLEKI